MKKNVISIFFGVLTFATVQSIKADTTNTIALWTFETSQPTTAGPINPESGLGSASGSHVGAAVYSSPAGNGSSHSYSANTWAVGDFWQFSVSTLGLDNIQLSYDQVSSGTGPGKFILKYSTDGSTFFDFGSQYSVLANSSPNSWSSTTPITTTTFIDDLSSITALNNVSTVYFRVVANALITANGATVSSFATTGTDRIDNFSVFTVTPVPEPATIALATFGGVAAFLVAVRRKR